METILSSDPARRQNLQLNQVPRIPSPATHVRPHVKYLHCPHIKTISGKRNNGRKCDILMVEA